MTRITVFCFFLSIVQVMAVDSYAQMTRMSLKVENERLENVFSKIEDESEFFFLYNKDLIDVEQLVSVDAQNETIKAILDEVLAGKDIAFTVFNRQIVLSNIDMINEIVAQQRTVSGTVTDESGQPLPGVAVVVKGTTTGTVTNADGDYTLANIPEDATLVYSFVGMRTQEVVVGNQTSINKTMLEETIGLEEVVAIGYGTQKKENLTGAIGYIKMDKILGSRPVSSVATAIQGSIPGLQITSGSGQPGQPSSIRIRGIESINGGDPLILVDNVPMDIEDINPADIESISVLKDAASSSIYGGRAAFGVILINTKKGNRNRPIKFNYTNNFATSNATEIPEKVSTQEIITALKTFGQTNLWTGQDLTTWSNLLNEYKNNPEKYSDGETYVDGTIYRLEEKDLYKIAMTNSFEQRHNFSFSGGSEKADYRVSFGYADENGILITNKDRFQKFNVNVYLNANLTDRLTSTSNILYDNKNRSTPSNIAYLFTSIGAVGRHINTGYYTGLDGSKIPFFTANNMLEIEPPDSNKSEDLRIFEKLEYNLTKGLNLTGEYTYIKSNDEYIALATDNIYYDIHSYVPVPITSRGAGESSYRRQHGSTDYNALNIYVSYDKNFADHAFKFLAGTNQELSKYSQFWTRRSGLLNSDVPSLATAAGTITTNESFSDYAISGYFSRLNYNYKDKYLLEANIRYDGSSKFPKGDRFGAFPSFSAGWIITEESFMKSIGNILNFMKIRGSYGEIGNQSISNYAFIPGMSTFIAPIIDPGTSLRALSMYPPSLVSSSFTWETVRTKNVGVDMMFLDRKLNVSFDYYNRETLNMLGAGSELPAVIGAPAPNQNVADLKSKGWELSINWGVNKKDFGYSFGVNLSDDRGFITKFDNEGGLLSQYYEGFEFGEIWGYETQGYYTEDDFVSGTLDANLMNGTLKEGIPAYYTVVKPNPGDIRFVDIDGDGKIDPGSSTLSDPGDRKIIGNSNRRYQFGITGNAFYKNFDFSLFIQGVGKRDVWINNQSFWPWMSMYQGFYDYQLDYWSAENTNGYYPRMYKSAVGNTSISRLPQTKYLLNGAYLRIKNIELGYTLPELFLNKIGADRTRLFVTAENLLKFDHLPKGLDTEVDQINYGVAYPYIRKFSIGLNVTF